MGIKNLNRFLLKNCTKNAIYGFHLSNISNKTVVIDISIYLYKFVADGSLEENMNKMISMFNQYHIIPIFIFDGKPPEEKRLLLYKRWLEKKEAEKKYNDLQKLLGESEEFTKSQLEQLEFLKKQFIRIKTEDIDLAKSILDKNKIEYHIAPEEADQLCARFIKSKKAYACVSDDMDMFLYGCDIVIRNICLKSNTATFYNTFVILKELKMSLCEFREIMVLSGTDYNVNDCTNLFETLKWYNKYKNTQNKKTTLGFYRWLQKNTNYIDNYELLIRILNMFEIAVEPKVARHCMSLSSATPCLTK